MQHTYNLAGYDTWKCCVPEDDPDMDADEIEFDELCDCNEKLFKEEAC